jgi:hypothetical protein
MWHIPFILGDQAEINCLAAQALSEILQTKKVAGK